MAQMQMWRRRGGSSWGMGRPGRLRGRAAQVGPVLWGREGGVRLGGGGDGVKGVGAAVECLLR